MSIDPIINQQIQQRYGGIAGHYMDAGTRLPMDMDGCYPQTANTVVSEESSLAEMLYREQEIDDLPASVTEVSLGCGNPLAIANLLPGETVLDLGSGGGIDCFLAAKAVGTSGHVIGVDVTEKMIALANQNKRQMGLTNVEFRQGAIERLPVASQSVDVIISNCVIDISPDKEAVFGEAFRVLKPAGRLFISDTVTEGHFPDAAKANVDQWAGAVITPLIDKQLFLQLIREAGFSDVSVDSRVSYGLEDIDSLDEASQSLLTNGVDWSTVPKNAGLYSIRVSARKVARS